jgi:hypothetical protein
MEYKGVRYSLRQGITRAQWRVAVYPPNAHPIERPVTGRRQEAEQVAHYMIETWLRQQRQPENG